TEKNSPLMFFVNGRQIDLDSRAEELEASIKRICNQQPLTVEDLQPWLDSDKTYKLLAELLENGELYCVHED
ncbi:MAG: winged helix domain-containing protein, partial [Pseudomonadales bacterium]